MATTFAKKRPADKPAPQAVSGPIPITQDAPRRRRRPVVVGAGLALAAVGALVAAWQVDEAGDRVAVIALAHDVKAGQVVKKSDLVVAQVAPDPALAPVPVGRSGDIVGKTAASDLPKGTLVTDGSVREGSPVAQGRDTVGILAKPGQLPAQRLRAGDAVALVHTPQDDADAAKSTTQKTPDSINAVVVGISAADANGAVVVDVAVAGTDSAPLATWAARGAVTIVLKAGH
ncbi:SAF domain-containing protein [Streptomyces lavendulae]|uniref:SAF domain-containing protein n=1 Tax=Streptomyces lavendulae TaxID=1914 RepID=UPI0024A17BE0|nr:SAF domain-containing protein [Streptomyces lavendulae]GLX22560.1 flagellar protein FlgA [Streptomyces lavendulae subsp. lavendulae]GLX30043.1 flagellar protein FlgA [Streptomyces lavendulae subsp. lavendulae]